MMSEHGHFQNNAGLSSAETRYISYHTYPSGTHSVTAAGSLEAALMASIAATRICGGGESLSE